jgi:tyrosine-protein phosphatase SIW14
MLDRIRPLVCLFVAGVLPALAGNAPGIKNFDQVDDHVYRGAQPTEEAFRYLAGIGVKIVIDLREAGDRAKAEERIVKEAGMVYVNVPMTDLTPPTETDLLKILPVLENSTGGSVFVHCLRGADRTGAVIAAYHIDHDHWDNARALKDAKAHDMGFFQIPRQNFIKNFQPLAINAKNAAQGEVPATAPTAMTAEALEHPPLPRP